MTGQCLFIIVRKYFIRLHFCKWIPCFLNFRSFEGLQTLHQVLHYFHFRDSLSLKMENREMSKLPLLPRASVTKCCFLYIFYRPLRLSRETPTQKWFFLMVVLKSSSWKLKFIILWVESRWLLNCHPPTSLLHVKTGNFSDCFLCSFYEVTEIGNKTGVKFNPSLHPNLKDIFMGA